MKKITTESYLYNGVNTSKLKLYRSILDLYNKRYMIDEVSYSINEIDKIYHIINAKNPHIYRINDNRTTYQYIQLSFIENIKFRYIQKILWIQQEQNLRYIVNILFLTLGIIGFLSI